MIVLAIESAFEAVSVALSVEGETAERFAHEPRGHAERLLPWVSELLSEAELTLGDVDAIAFSRGPGSFTSLRIGIGVVQGLAWGADIPVVPVSSLAATAQTAAHRSVVPRTVVAMDARMGEVYAAAFRLEEGIMLADGEEWLGAPENLALPEGNRWSAVGNGFERFEVLAGAAEAANDCDPQIWPRASAVATLALDWMLGNEPLPVELAQPVYLRDKVAEKPRSSS